MHLSIYVATSYTVVLCSDQIGFGSDNFESDRNGTENFGSDSDQKVSDRMHTSTIKCQISGGS